MKSNEASLRGNGIMKTGYGPCLALLICVAITGCESPGQLDSKVQTRRSLPPDEQYSEQSSRQLTAEPAEEPLEITDLLLMASPAAPTTAPAVVIVAQAAPVTYTWKAIKSAPEAPTSASSEIEQPEESPEDWEPMQPVVIFEDNLSDRTTKAPAEQPASGDETPLIDRKKAQTLGEDQLAMFDKLQGKILKLLLALRESEERNVRLQRALIEAREACSLTRADLNRKAIIIEMHKGEIADLRERLAKVSPGKASPTQPASTTQPADDFSALSASQLRRRNKRLKLQLKLATLEGPEKTQNIVTKLAEMTDRFNELEDVHVKLSHLVVVQADQIKALQNVQRRARQARTMKLAERQDSIRQGNRKAFVKEADIIPQVITGTIKAIRGSAVVINMGSRQGLEKGMRMIVYREDKFIGYLCLDEIGEAESTGTLVRKVIEPKVGDNVVDRLE